MATILLQAAGGFVGGVLGGPLGAVVGRAAGGLAGAAVDGSLLGGTRRVEGARLTSARIMEADEGAGIPRVYGTARVTGQMIWATRFEESATTERSGGKGGGPRVETTSYSYAGNFAVGLCEGPVAGLRRVWADGEELDLSEVVLRLHRGTEDQRPDPLIEARQGTGQAPAYRGLAYLVFERLALERWGNRLPQISAEVIRPVGELENAIRAVTIIPGASEHGLDPLPVRERLGRGEDRLLNRNVLHGSSDWNASIDELTSLCPKLGRAALVSAWFGNDLRAGHCQIRPGVEISRREEETIWRAGDCDRTGARLISRIDGGPAYGGTPSEAGVIRAVRDLKARGLKVTYYPFLLMDVPPGNGLPDPYGGSEQVAFPWRGRMTLETAIGSADSPDGTEAARVAIEMFLGQARPGDFAVEDGEIRYFGPEEWSYRRMVLHQAMVAREAGADAFVIGSEMRGLTRVRDETGAFAFVEGLMRLAEDVKTLLPDAVVTYAADWSEYFGYQPADGSGDVFYNLDTLWASAAIDVVGIDNYLPLADRRDVQMEGDGPSAHDRATLAAGIAGGEYFDWYYADDTARAAGLRAPITDGAAGKPWVFRPKDLAGWWSNPHVERRGGVEVGGPTAWVPRSKPIWFTELGCPAIDKGANQPNVFVDPKSSESLLPYFSLGGRDDLIQRRFLEAQLGAWDETSAHFAPAINPRSDLYDGRMVPAEAIHLWTWDARPYPAFPERADLWSDGGNWRRGHWLTGRLGTAPCDALIATLLADHGIENCDAAGVDALVTGFVTTGPLGARQALEDIMRLVGAIAFARGESFSFRSLARDVEPLAIEALVDGEGPYAERTRSEAGERAEEVAIGYLDPARAYQPPVAEASRATSATPRKYLIDLPAVLPEETARRLARDLLDEVGSQSERAAFDIAPTMIVLEPGDVVELAGHVGRWLVEGVEHGPTCAVEARLLQRSRAGLADLGGSGTVPIPPRPTFASRPHVVLLNLPLPEGGDASDGGRIAVHARPFAGYLIETRPPGGSFNRAAVVRRGATMGRLTAPLGRGWSGLFDRAGRLRVRLDAGALASIDRSELLAGGNLAAVRAANGVWEVLQFERAEEIAPGEFELSHLLRGQGGTEDAAAAGAETGADFVLLDAGAVSFGFDPSDAGAVVEVRTVPYGRAPDDPAVVTASASLGERAMRPLSPVHASAIFGADGSCELSWIRRTRTGGDRWEGPDVPLGEEREIYAIDIADAAGAAILSRQAESPRLTLTPGEQEAAFGGLPDRLAVTISQLSPVWGRGGSLSVRFDRRIGRAQPTR